MSFEAADDLTVREAFGLTPVAIGAAFGVSTEADHRDDPRALLACRSPERLSRCQLALPDDALTGFTPHRAAKPASVLIPSPLSPAAINSFAATSGDTPCSAARVGAAAWIILSRTVLRRLISHVWPDEAIGMGRPIERYLQRPLSTETLGSI